MKGKRQKTTATTKEHNTEHSEENNTICKSLGSSWKATILCGEQHLQQVVVLCGKTIIWCTGVDCKAHDCNSDSAMTQYIGGVTIARSAPYELGGIDCEGVAVHRGTWQPDR
jgi:hypothetical protein